jgi:hypothetical protein
VNGKFDVKDIAEATGMGHLFERPRDREILNRLERWRRFEAAARRAPRDPQTESRWIAKLALPQALTSEEWSQLHDYLQRAYPQDGRVYERADFSVVTQRYPFDFAIWREASPLNWIAYSTHCRERVNFVVDQFGMNDTEPYLHARLLVLAQFHDEVPFLARLVRAWERLPAPQPFARRLDLANALARSTDPDISALAEPVFARYRPFLTGDKDCQRLVDEAGGTSTRDQGDRPH